MNEFQDKVFVYLTVQNHPERVRALYDLTERGLFNKFDASSGVLDEDHFRAVVTAYLTENPQGFCTDGINRFREALDFVEAEEAATVRVVLDIDVQRTPGILGTKPGSGPTTDCGVVYSAVEAVVSSLNKGLEQRAKHLRLSAGDHPVRWLDYEVLDHLSGTGDGRDHVLNYERRGQ